MAGHANNARYDDGPDFNQDEREAPAPEIGSLAVLNKSEIHQQIQTARDFPRSIKNFRNEALQLATLDERTASECIYALPRDGKTIEGPSARFAEIVNYAWGNTRAGARVIAEEGEFVTSQGLFYDLEKNTAISYEVKRRIVDKNGRRFKVDMIGTTSNAASSIALRNAILKGIPKALWHPIYQAARKVVAGDIRTLVSRRDEAIKAFQIFNVTAEMIYATLGVGGVQDITIDHLVILKGILTAIQEGDTTPEQAFSTQDENLAGKSASNLGDIKNRYHQGSNANPQKAQGETQPQAQEPQQEATQEPFDARAATEKVLNQRSPNRQPTQTRTAPRGQAQPGEPLSFTDRPERQPGEE